jgi:hypothetical protein
LILFLGLQGGKRGKNRVFRGDFRAKRGKKELCGFQGLQTSKFSFYTIALFPNFSMGTVLAAEQLGNYLNIDSYGLDDK